jgi:hypothetical protein
MLLLEVTVGTLLGIVLGTGLMERVRPCRHCAHIRLLHSALGCQRCKGHTARHCYEVD